MTQTKSTSQQITSGNGGWSYVCSCAIERRALFSSAVWVMCIMGSRSRKLGVLQLRTFAAGHVLGQIRNGALSPRHLASKSRSRKVNWPVLSN